MAWIRNTPVLRGLPAEAGVVAAIAFCVALGFGIAAPALPLYARFFGVSAFLAGAVISIFALMRLLASQPAGWLIGRVGERIVLTSGLVIVAVSSAAAGAAQSFPQLLVMRSLGGIGSSMFTVAAMSLLLRLVAANQRGQAASAFQAGFLLGAVAGPAVGGAVIGWSIRAPFFVYAATLTVAAFVAWRYLPPAPPDLPATERDTGDSSDGEPGHELAGEPGIEPGELAEELATPDVSEPTASEVDTGTVRPPAASLGQAMRRLDFLAALGANMTTGFVTFGLRTSLVPLFIVEGLQAPAALSGIAFLVAAGAQALTLVPAGRTSDRRGRKPALLLGLFGTLIGMIALAVAGAPWSLLLAMTLLGAAAAFLGSAPAAVAGDVAGRSGRGGVIATFQMVADFGAIIGPLAAGLIADRLGYTWAFATGAAVAAAALVLASAMPETLAQRSATQAREG